MEIVKAAQSGTMQSSDLMIFLEPADELSIEIDSTVGAQFGHLIRAQVEEVLARHQVSRGRIRINDRGALDYAIVARLETGLKRAAGSAAGEPQGSI